MAQIFCFGDSITYGSWDEQQAGWTQRLRLKLDERMRATGEYTLLYNLGIPSETTEGLVKRFAAETVARISTKEKEEAIFIFAFGANDAKFIPTRQVFQVSETQYVHNLSEVMSKAKKWSAKILFLNITPLNEVVTANPPGKDHSRRNEWMQQYNTRLAQFCQENEVALLDVNGAFRQLAPELLLVEDGVHPNAAGHQLICDLVWPALLQFLSKPVSSQ